MKDLDFEKFVAAMAEGKLDVEISLKTQNGKWEVCIIGSEPVVLTEAEELISRIINSACGGRKTVVKDLYTEFCKGLKERLEL